ncbi:MAG: glycoside hydrolase family 127 protein [Lachnospiraceae bacterium]|nr:glycoside hydrolase family 127 protein [Lachnospiraceae bacterium]
MKHRKIKSFDISSVQLRDPQFLAGQEAVLSFIRKIEPERVLSAFRRNAGLSDKGFHPYPGWENARIGGHALGHYFSAAAMAARAFLDDGLREKLDYIVRELRKCQIASGNGFLSAASPALPAYPDIQFDIDEGKAEGETWVPWYALHKVLQGLCDIFIFTENEEALEAAEALADWVWARTAGWDQAVRRRILSSEYGGMNDTLYLLYELSGKESYRKAAEAFDDPMLYKQLTEDRDALDGVHANTTIPKFIGALRRACALPEAKDSDLYFHFAEAFFKRVTETQMYATGGVGDMEHFRKDGMLDHARTQCNAESCCVYNMMKLAKMLFQMTGDPRYADYIERALFNARLGSVHPSGGTTYFNPMGTGFFKVFGNSDPDKNVFWCCTGTGMEDFVKLAESLYFQEGDALIVNQYISSEVNWTERGVLARMEADLPSGKPFSFRLRAERDAELRIRFRIPEWTKKDAFRVRRSDGSDERSAAPGRDYLELACRLEAGGTAEFEIVCPAGLRAEGLPDAADALAFLYGPLVLAAELPAEDGKELAEAGIEVVAPAWKILHPGAVKLDISYGKTFRGILKEEYRKLPEGASFAELAEKPGAYMKRIGGEGLSFELDGLRFRPFYEIAEQRYGIYWYWD